MKRWPKKSQICRKFAPYLRDEKSEAYKGKVVSLPEIHNLLGTWTGPELNSPYFHWLPYQDIGKGLKNREGLSHHPPPHTHTLTPSKSPTVLLLHCPKCSAFPTTYISEGTIIHVFSFSSAYEFRQNLSKFLFDGVFLNYESKTRFF